MATKTKTRKPRRGGVRVPSPGKRLGAPPSARGYVILATRVLPEHREALDQLAHRLGSGQSEALRALLSFVCTAENSCNSEELYKSLLLRLRASE